MSKQESATVVIAQSVLPGREPEYEAWQASINEAAQKFEGFEGAEVIRPTPGIQDEYVVLYRFDTRPHLRAWLESPTREGWLDKGRSLFAAEAVVHTLATGRPGKPVTVLVSHRVRPGSEEAYRRWQAGINRAARGFPGFVSSELFEASDDQPDWIVVFRFDSDANLQRWLDSPDRAAWLSRAEPLIDEWRLHKVGGGLGGWFELHSESGTARVAPAWKQAMTVLLALYPTVMLLAIGVVPHLSRVPFAVAVLVSNVLSVALLTWLVMPAANRLLRRWLEPGAGLRVTVLGTAGLVAVYAAFTALFWAAT